MMEKKTHEHLKYLQYDFIYILNGTKFFFFMAPNQRTIKNTAELVLLINQVRELSFEKAR